MLKGINVVDVNNIFLNSSILIRGIENKWKR
jgi:hypothetical protein